jgi:cell division inhibitor SulA
MQSTSNRPDTRAAHVAPTPRSYYSKLRTKSRASDQPSQKVVKLSAPSNANTVESYVLLCMRTQRSFQVSLGDRGCIQQPTSDQPYPAPRYKSRASLATRKLRLTSQVEGGGNHHFEFHEASRVMRPRKPPRCILRKPILYGLTYFSRVQVLCTPSTHATRSWDGHQGSGPEPLASCTT